MTTNSKGIFSTNLYWQIKKIRDIFPEFFLETLDWNIHALFASNGMNLRSEMWTDGCSDFCIFSYFRGEDIFSTPTGNKKPIYFHFAVREESLKCFTLIVSNRWLCQAHYIDSCGNTLWNINLFLFCSQGRVAEMFHSNSFQ